jgi:hypothetical protein
MNACYICRQPDELMEWHHPAGREAMPAWTVPVCPDCHRTIHIIWRQLNIDPPGWTPVTLFRRLAVLVYMSGRDWQTVITQGIEAT